MNQALEDAPELLNHSPYAEGWIIEIKPDDASELEAIMDKDAYLQMLTRGPDPCVIYPIPLKMWRPCCRWWGLEEPGCDLFSEMVPDECGRRGDPPDLPEPLTEWELYDHMVGLSGKRAVTDHGGNPHTAFIGAGRYEHFIPESIAYLLGRSEFSTTYTPYQPEMSQGTLQAIYEYQTLTARLLGLDVANASLYDGASALAEALLMAVRITRKRKVALSRLIHPHYRQVVQTYLNPVGTWKSF